MCTCLYLSLSMCTQHEGLCEFVCVCLSVYVSACVGVFVPLCVCLNVGGAMTGGSLAL